MPYVQEVDSIFLDAEDDPVRSFDAVPDLLLKLGVLRRKTKAEWEVTQPQNGRHDRFEPGVRVSAVCAWSERQR